MKTNKSGQMPPNFCTNSFYCSIYFMLNYIGNRNNMSFKHDNRQCLEMYIHKGIKLCKNKYRHMQI